MNTRSVLAHAILAVGGLTLAYLVWTDDAPQREVDEVELVGCDPDSVTAARLSLDDKDVSLEISRDGGALFARATVVRHREDADDETKRFVASSEQVSEWLEQVAPLRARRTLGVLDEEQLAEIGLAEEPGSFSLTCGGTTHTYQVGGRAYGSGDRYVRSESGGAVHLLGVDRLQGLESAEFRMMERRLHTFEWTEAERLRVQAWGQTRELLQRNRLDEQNAQWVDARDPDRRNEAFGNWLSAYPRMRVQTYLDPDAEPGSDLDEPAEAEPSIQLTIAGPDGELGRMELRRVDQVPLAYYVRTETTRDWVRVPSSVAQAFEDDARSILGLDPLERPEPPAREAPTPEPGESDDADAETESEGAAPEAADDGSPEPEPAPAEEPAPAPAEEPATDPEP